MWRVVSAHADGNTAFEVRQRPDLLLIKSSLTPRVPHMVLDPRMAPGNERAWTAALVEEWAGNTVSLMVMIPPGTERGELARALGRWGFARATRPSIAMARFSGSTREHREDADIELATGEDDLAEARRLLATIFDLPEHVFAYYTPQPLVRTYMLRERGIGVAAACLCPFAGAAGVYSVGVLPAVRGKGYAQRLVLQLLSDAADLGLNTAVLSCERHYVPLYRRLGFSVCCELMTYWMEAL
jgi:GNAT superfamily N-acetyltransferase